MSEPRLDDTVQGPRSFTGTLARILALFAAAASLYHLLTAGFGAPEAMDTTGLLFGIQETCKARRRPLRRCRGRDRRGHMIDGDLEDARNFARRAQAKLKRGSPGWLKAEDILNLRPDD